MTAHVIDKPARPLIGWRLLALFYDLWPMAAVWMLVSAGFTFGHYAAGHGLRENIQPFSALAWLLWITCWCVTGAYAIGSWRRGGQTLGMRPWRLHVVDAHGNNAPLRALVVRYLIGTLSLLAGGLGFWWAWFDRDRLAWHDRASGTRMIRAGKAR